MDSRIQPREKQMKSGWRRRKNQEKITDQALVLPADRSMVMERLF